MTTNFINRGVVSHVDHILHHMNEAASSLLHFKCTYRRLKWNKPSEPATSATKSPDWNIFISVENWYIIVFLI